MKHHVIIEKKVGETPLQALERFRHRDAQLQDVPLTYAGRLDPMAEGKLLILIGDECKKRADYDGLDKEYEFEVLLGVKSDTGDILGLAQLHEETKHILKPHALAVMRSLVGPHTFAYPAFSSKTVSGKPLFMHMHDETLDTLEMPSVDVVIHELRCTNIRTLGAEELFENIFSKLDLLSVKTDPARAGSDFRIGAIRAQWKALQSEGVTSFTILSCSAVVSAGTYIRTLAGLIGEKLGTYGLAYSIRRSKIGRFVSLTRNLGFWRKIF